jgi:hypothetical protein
MIFLGQIGSSFQVFKEFDMSVPVTTTATHLPGQLLEVARELDNAEKALTVPLTNITIAVDTDNNQITISATLPVIAAGTGGQVAYTATDYLV